MYFKGKPECPLIGSPPIVADKGSKRIWEGVLNAGPAKVPLRFEIALSGDKFVGKAISEAENNAQIPLTNMLVDEGNVTLKFGSINATFTGKVDSIDERVCVGQWTQNGANFDFTIKRVD